MYKFKLCLLTLLFILLASTTMLYASDTPTELLFINNEVVPLCAPIILKDEHVYLPLRDTSHFMNFEVEFDDKLQIVTASYNEDQFIYNIKQSSAFFNDTPIDLSIFIENNLTYVEGKSFFSLFGFNVDYDYSLFISKYLGQELLDLEYLSDPIYIDIYDDISVTSVFINTVLPGEYYTHGTHTVSITDSFYENETLFLTFNPYTLISPPKGYNTLDSQYVINHSPQQFSLPVHEFFTYDYLVSPYTLSQTTFLTKVDSDIHSGALNLATLTIQDGKVINITAIYTV